jgi:hypothetical protein
MRASHCDHQAIGVCRKVWSVRFWPNTASDPDADTIEGKGFTSVTHSATGQFLIKFTNPAYKVVGSHCGIGLATPAAAHLSVTFDNVGTNDPLEATLSHFTTALADIAADADNWLSLTVEVELSKEG